MGFARFTDMPTARLVSGNGFRTYRPGDEEAWLGTLATGAFGIWDRARSIWAVHGYSQTGGFTQRAL
jgi:hypothetical protein